MIPRVHERIGLNDLDDLTSSTALTDSVAVTVASELVDDYSTAVWLVTLAKSDGTRERWTVEASHDGTSGADATAATWSVYGLGPDGGNTLAVDVNGTGASQIIRLRVTANGTGWTAYVTRLYHKAA